MTSSQLGRLMDPPHASTGGIVKSDLDADDHVQVAELTVSAMSRHPSNLEFVEAAMIVLTQFVPKTRFGGLLSS